MSKVLAALIAGLFAAGAYAQAAKEATQEAAPVTGTKSQAAAEMRKDARPAGQVKAPGGDAAKSQEVAGVPSDKATMAGEKRAETRDTRRRNKDGSLKRRSTQGGTPQ